MWTWILGRNKHMLREGRRAGKYSRSTSQLEPFEHLWTNTVEHWVPGVVQSSSAPFVMRAFWLFEQIRWELADLQQMNAELRVLCMQDDPVGHVETDGLHEIWEKDMEGSIREPHTVPPAVLRAGVKSVGQEVVEVEVEQQMKVEMTLEDWTHWYLKGKKVALESWEAVPCYAVCWICDGTFDESSGGWLRNCIVRTDRSYCGGLRTADQDACRVSSSHADRAEMYWEHWVCIENVDNHYLVGQSVLVPTEVQKRFNPLLATSGFALFGHVKDGCWAEATAKKRSTTVRMTKILLRISVWTVAFLYESSMTHGRGAHLAAAPTANGHEIECKQRPATCLHCYYRANDRMYANRWTDIFSGIWNGTPRGDSDVARILWKVGGSFSMHSSRDMLIFQIGFSHRYSYPPKWMLPSSSWRPWCYSQFY